MSSSPLVYPHGVPAHAQGGTPSALPPDQCADALETIEFDQVVDLVAARTVGPLGAARVRARRPSDDLAWITGELARVGEVAGLFRGGDALLAEPIPDVTRALARLRIEGSVLEGIDLSALQRVLVASRLMQADLRRVADEAPLAGALARPVPDKALERRLEQSVDADGTLLDSASPRLAAARREVHAARQRLIRKLESLLRGLDATSAPVDASVTVRGGRYVIPVRRDSRSRPGGIIHDESGSAGTLFIEPAEAIELGNALREAEVEEEREALRVLRELTDLLRPELPAIRDLVEMCVAVDDLVARARYAVAVEGEMPEVAPAPADLVVVNGRHPLLLAGTEPVVPFDLGLPAGERTLLISGPNTGGKTVLLKAVGLAAALAQSGIIPPVGRGSRLPVFRRYYADIGDRQSIAASLSTFSAHVRMLRRMLDEADDATLVLLDEVGSGTDPAEGAALAAAALVSLTTRGTLTLATTHLGSLKDVASHTPGVVNASLQFDAATLTPTYRFLKGVPGRSYGLAIARRLGVAPAIVADAEARVPDAERSLDALLAAVEERQRELAAARAALADREVEMDLLGARLAAQQEAQAAREARRLVEEGIREQGEQLERVERTEKAERPEPAGAVAVGDRVRLAGGGAGQVLEIRTDGKLVVAMGAMKMVVDADQATRTAGKPPAAPSQAAAAPPAPDSPLEIDLRGMTGDEAEMATVAAVDAAVLAEQPYLRIIHGMGTGVVRERVRQVVSADRRVARFAFAPRNQGGTGVTIVEFSA